MNQLSPNPDIAVRWYAAFRRRGFSLIEVMVVMVVIVVLISMAAPSFHRSIEQSHADIAGANLRAIWTAQRLYWLDYRTYAGNLYLLAGKDPNPPHDDLEDLRELLDPAIVSDNDPYDYGIGSASTSSFTATATRSGSTIWSGVLSIDETGVIPQDDAITADGKDDIKPGFL